MFLMAKNAGGFILLFFRGFLPAAGLARSINLMRRERINTQLIAGLFMTHRAFRIGHGAERLVARIAILFEFGVIG
jgi:hypothetical protein